MWADSQECSNCRKLFPVDRIDLHEAYCCRNIRKCKQCDQMIDIKDQEQHDVWYIISFRNKIMTKSNVRLAIKWLTLTILTLIYRLVRENLWSVNFAKILGRFNNIIGIFRVVEQGRNHALFVTKILCLKIFKSIQAVVKEGDNRELRCLKILSGIEEITVIRGQTGSVKGKTVQTISDNSQ